MRYARRLTRKLLPDLAGTLAELSTALKSEIAATPVTPAVIHGDLYEGQVMVGADFSLALLDLDDLGMGDPALDAASFCAHLLALADTHPAAAPRILAYRALLRERFLARFDVGERGFAARESLVMLQLASGPFRVLEERWPERVRRRVELAQGLLTDWNRLERAG
ncbi:MAG: phosphotransferase [Dehalococcoidia bacterium]|nr:phosphotransferase [Dehalococcoidia bacterium]